MADGEILLDEILDAPGELFYPFSALRLHTVPEHLRITRGLHDAIATAMEDPTLKTDGAKARTGLGACLWAIGELERELVTLRRELASGQES